MNKDKFENFDPESFDNLLKSKEGTQLDRKQKITSREKIAKTIAAMANTEGGVLLVGISDKGEITGIDPEEELYMIQSANETYCHPPTQIKSRTIHFRDFDTNQFQPIDKYFLIVSITKNPGTFWIGKSGEKKYFERKGDRTISISGT
ncbi:MAG: ATP-binding protein [Algoriphagus sp.]|uniref:AlbA family DNA-binding domain-containing protein n=1 Tax=Algoriphagus sp. TaxID=1872435 RepID=UPI00179C03EE|nr:ATP-binding protein [Algoriphagus sp.]NVJ86125.1 ATP-binding protein [Algoriphagus sp.]